jgi:iron-sulfur cluster repair protein YtfE (RIC family)
MVMYHTRYREKMQDVMHLIKKAYEDTGDDSERVAIIARATSTFMRGMRELSVHVQIEEEHVFPRYEQEFPDIDFSWLYEDHKGLHEKEDDTMKVLGAASAKVKLSRAEVLQLATTLMAFDDALNNHLGEEEEVVTPLALFANVGVA